MNMLSPIPNKSAEKEVKWQILNLFVWNQQKWQRLHIGMDNQTETAIAYCFSALMLLAEWQKLDLACWNNHLVSFLPNPASNKMRTDCGFADHTTFKIELGLGKHFDHINNCILTYCMICSLHFTRGCLTRVFMVAQTRSLKTMHYILLVSCAKQTSRPL